MTEITCVMAKAQAYSTLLVLTRPPRVDGPVWKQTIRKKKKESL
jgi:hypothetical protein